MYTYIYIHARPVPTTNLRRSRLAPTAVGQIDLYGVKIFNTWYEYSRIDGQRSENKSLSREISHLKLVDLIIL